MLLIYFPILPWAPQSVLHYLSRGFWARLCTRAHAWLFRGCNSTGTLRGRRTGFWSSSSLTPEGRWSTKHTGQSKDNSERYMLSYMKKSITDISIIYRQLRQLSFANEACFLRLPPVPIRLFFSLDTAVLLELPAEQAVPKPGGWKIWTSTGFQTFKLHWFYLLRGKEEIK